MLFAEGIMLRKAQGEYVLAEHGDSGHLSHSCYKSVLSKISFDKLSLSFLGESWSNNFLSTNKVAFILHDIF